MKKKNKQQQPNRSAFNKLKTTNANYAQDKQNEFVGKL